MVANGSTAKPITTLTQLSFIIASFDPKKGARA
jgi:hypothetical protein